MHAAAPPVPDEVRGGEYVFGEADAPDPSSEEEPEDSKLGEASESEHDLYACLGLDFDRPDHPDPDPGPDHSRAQTRSDPGTDPSSTDQDAL